MSDPATDSTCGHSCRAACLGPSNFLAGGNPLRVEALARLLRLGGGRLRHALFLAADETCFAVYDDPPGGSPRATATARIVRAMCSSQGRRASERQGVMTIGRLATAITAIAIGLIGLCRLVTGAMEDADARPRLEGEK